MYNSNKKWSGAASEHINSSLSIVNHQLKTCGEPIRLRSEPALNPVEGINSVEVPKECVLQIINRKLKTCGERSRTIENNSKSPA